jgi:hypothetical protein
MTNKCDTGTDLLKDSLELDDLINEYCKSVPPCEKCESKLIQFISCTSIQADWSCHHCKHRFITKKQ